MLRLLENVAKRIAGKFALYKYNDFTIAEYFRKQGALIGEKNRIEIRSLGPEPFLIKVGNHCTIAPGVQFLTHDGGTWLFTNEYPSLQAFGQIEVLDNVFLGANAIIMKNVRIGPNSIVGAGAIVTKDVPENTIVAGNPAKVVGTIQEYKSRVLELWKEQRPSNYFSDLEDGKEYDPEIIQHKKLRDKDILRKHLTMKFGFSNNKDVTSRPNSDR